jgi:hypothetical protein
VVLAILTEFFEDRNSIPKELHLENMPQGSKKTIVIYFLRSAKKAGWMGKISATGDPSPAAEMILST